MQVVVRVRNDSTELAVASGVQTILLKDGIVVTRIRVSPSTTTVTLVERPSSISQRGGEMDIRKGSTYSGKLIWEV